MNENDMPCCARCKRKGIPLSFEPTMSQMIFGGFRGSMMENRCDDCEKQVAKVITKILDNITDPKKVKSYFP